MESLSSEFVKVDINDLVACINNPGLRVNHPPHNLVKDEFKTFVKREISDRRKNSSITQLRTFHNEIKRTLINNISSGKSLNLLDIAVGRGGDISKWKSANIKNVFGFDKSRDSIESINPFNQGARERLRNFSGIKTNIQFDVGDATQPTRELMDNLQKFMETYKIHGFDIMSCQFALHYFFKSERALQTVFEYFGSLIKQGGYFIGTTVDGQKIIDLLNGDKKFESVLLSVTKSYKSIIPRIKYDNSYTFKINDSFDQGNYFNTMGESIEYLVNIPELIKVAKKYNFEPVYLNFFEPIPGKKNEYSKTENFVSFQEIYERNFLNIPLTREELLINNLYTTFIFKKV
jgi:mRNA (guanine-N7-)-methyltransferase